MLKPRSLALLIALPLASCHGGDVPLIHPNAAAVTQPPPVNQVEDAAIWVHPTDPARCLLLVTNRQRGVELHNADGMLLKTPEQPRPDNLYRGIDVAHGFRLTGEAIDVALVASRDSKGVGVTAYRIDADKQRLRPLNGGEPLSVLDGRDPLGLWTYRSTRTGRHYFFVTDDDGAIEQHQMTATPDGRLTARLVRKVRRDDKVKAGVADDARGVFYFADEEAGLYAADADPPARPDAPLDARPVALVGDRGIEGDLVGLAIYEAPGRSPGDDRDGGCIVMVGQRQRNHRSLLYVFDRTPPHAMLATVEPLGDDAVYNSSAIAVTAKATTLRFPHGFLALKNRITANASEQFKLYAWPAIMPRR